MAFWTGSATPAPSAGEGGPARAAAAAGAELGSGCGAPAVSLLSSFLLGDGLAGRRRLLLAACSPWPRAAVVGPREAEQLGAAVAGGPGWLELPVSGGVRGRLARLLGIPDELPSATIVPPLPVPAAEDFPLKRYWRVA